MLVLNQSRFHEYCLILYHCSVRICCLCRRTVASNKSLPRPSNRSLSAKYFCFCPLKAAANTTKTMRKLLNNNLHISYTESCNEIDNVHRLPVTNRQKKNGKPSATPNTINKFNSQLLRKKIIWEKRVITLTKTLNYMSTWQTTAQTCLTRYNILKNM